MKKTRFELISQFLSGEEKSTEEQINEWSLSENSSLEPIIYQHGTTHVLSNHVFTDLDWFTQEKDRPSILRSISRTQTPFGDIMMKECFESVLSDKTIISYRQEAIQHLIQRTQLTKELKEILGTLENTSSDLTWFWKPDQEDGKGEFQLLHDIVYFSLPIIGSYLNQNDMILNLLSTYRIFLTPLFCIITPLLAFLVPYFAMRRLGVEVTLSQVFHLLKTTVFTSSLIPPKTKFLAGLSVFVWIVFFVQNVYTNLKMASLSHSLTCILHKKLSVLSKLAQATERIKSLLEHSILLKWLDPPKEEPPLELLHSCFEQEHGLFSAKGTVLATYTQVKSILEGYIKKSMRFLGRVDMVCSMVTYLQEVEEESLPWCFATFGRKKYSLKDLWNPILYTKETKPIPNTLSLGKKANLVLLTGPNAAGKSTFIRTMMINAILSQTFGVVLARKWSTPAPFTYIDTYMNVPDVEGHASLFEAEMYRCLEYLKRLEEHPQEPMLLVMDEIFSSTNYREGFSAAYSILRYLATTFPHLLGFVTTHFHGLTELEQHSNGKIRNFCFDATKKDGKINYTYELHRGSSQTHLALEILEQNGIGHEILRIANQMYMTLDNPKIPAFI